MFAFIRQIGPPHFLTPKWPNTSIVFMYHPPSIYWALAICISNVLRVQSHGSGEVEHRWILLVYISCKYIYFSWSFCFYCQMAWGWIHRSVLSWLCGFGFFIIIFLVFKRNTLILALRFLWLLNERCTLACSWWIKMLVSFYPTHLLQGVQSGINQLLPFRRSYSLKETRPICNENIIM